MPIRRLEKTYTGTTSTIGGDEIAASTIEVKPHIKPGVLQPAVAGKLLNGATHSGAYGTAQTQSGGDGHSYYYTDIKGSKPIKDPRIGAHFGSQRHKIKSIQLLEQETASHGRNVYSTDGREWFRVVDLSSTQSLYIINSTGGYGTSTYQSDNAFYEVTGYFNNFNVNVRCLANRVDDVNVTINGGTTRNSSNTDLMGGKTTATNPMEGRDALEQMTDWMSTHMGPMSSTTR